MSDPKFLMLPATKQDLFELYLVIVKSKINSDWFSEIRFPPSLYQPAQDRPDPSQPAPKPTPEPVILDRVARIASVMAEKFDIDAPNNIRQLKACVVGGKDDGKIVGFARWTPATLWGASSPQGIDGPLSDAQKALNAIQVTDCGAELVKKSQKIRDRVLPDKGSAWELNHLFVLPAYQGKGIGTALVHEGLEYISQTNSKPCFLESTTGAGSFYTRLGFELVGDFGIKGWKGRIPRDGEEMDTYVMKCFVKW